MAQAADKGVADLLPYRMRHTICTTSIDWLCHVGEQKEGFKGKQAHSQVLAAGSHRQQAIVVAHLENSTKRDAHNKAGSKELLD